MGLHPVKFIHSEFCLLHLSRLRTYGATESSEANRFVIPFSPA